MEPLRNLHLLVQKMPLKNTGAWMVSRAATLSTQTTPPLNSDSVTDKLYSFGTIAYYFGLCFPIGKM